MTSGEPGQQLTPRLNPFAFPSDTDFRFWLLIFTVFGSSLFVYRSILTRWVLPKHLLGVKGDLRLDYHVLITHELASQIQHNREILLPWIVGTTLFLLIVTCVIYWSYPYRMLRRSSLVPFHDPEVENVAVYVENLCLEVGLSCFPNFVWNPLNPAKTGQAFGCFGRYYVALSGGLVTQFYTDRPTFRAVVLHELAHLKNGDIDKTYFTVAIWQAFVIAALVPFAVSRFRAPVLGTVDLGWRVLALTALVYLTRTSVLRTREFYADVRASVWEGQSGALRSVLAGMPQPRTGIWQHLFQVHPQSLERMRILEDTYPLFKMKFWDAFGAGIAAGIVSPYIKDLLDYTAEFTVSWLGSAVLIPLAVSAVGVQIWRGTFAEMMRARVLAHTWRVGLALASGLFVGPTLSLTFTTNMSSQAPVILWDAVLLISVASFMPWIAAGASTWLEVALTLRSPRTIYRSGLIVAGLLLGIWYALVSASAQASASFLNWGIAVLFIFPISDPLFLVVSTGLWAFPLSAWFWRARLSSFESEWAFLDRPAQKLTFARQVPLSLGVALKVGVLGGLIASLVAVIALTAQRVGPLVTRIRHSSAYFVEWTVLVVLIEAAVSEVVRRRVRRLPVAHGLFAAAIAGWLVVLATLGVRLSFKEAVTAGDVVSRYDIVIGGTMASLLVFVGWQSLNRVYHWLSGMRSEDTFQRVLGNFLRASESHSISRYFGINLGWLERRLRFAIENLQNRKLGRRLVLGLALMVMTFLGVLLERSYKEVALSSRLREGSVCLEMRDYDWAISVYRKALLLQPDNADAHNGLGKALAQKGQFGEATTEFRKALVLKSNTADPHFNLGFALGMQGKVEEAIAESREAIRLDPGYAGAHNNLAVGLLRQGKHEEAIVEFREAIRLNPTYAEPHYHLGNELRVRNEDEKAILEFREAIRLNPEYAEAYNNLGISLQTQRKFEEATAEFREAVRLSPTDGRYRYNLIDNLHRHGNYDESIAELQKVFAFQPSDSCGINDDLGYFLALPGRFDEVIGYVSKSLSTSKGEAYTLNSFGLALDVYALNWFRKAADAVEAHGMSGLGFMYENGRGGLTRDDVQAVSWYRKAADAGNMRAMANLGRMYAFGRGGLTRDDVQAVSWYRKAADAGGSRGMSGLGFMFANGRGLPRNDVQAVSWFRKAADAGDAHGMCGLGFMYESGRGGLHKDNEEAVKWYRNAVNAGDALAMADLGFLYENGGAGLPRDTEEAVKWYRKAADAGNAIAMANLGGMYFEGSGRLPTDDAQAVSWFRKAADAGDAWGMYKLGAMYESGLGGLPKDNTQAVRWYSKAAVLGVTDAGRALKRLRR